MARNLGTPGAGRNAGRGLSLGRRQRLEAAKQSVPTLEWDNRGIAVLKNATAQQKTGLRVKAQQFDWELVVEGDDYTIINNKLNRLYRERQEKRRKIRLVGFLKFHRGFAEYKAETDEHAAGLVALCEKQGWNYHPRGNGVFHVCKRAKVA